MTVPSCLTEPARQTPVLGEFDVVVLGGGALWALRPMTKP